MESWDVIVVGAGMAGLLSAYYLQEAGKKVLVLEADKVASGQTGRTTAKITSQHGLKYSKLIKAVGARKAKLYAQANEAAIREYEKLIRKNGIECQFERVPACLYSMRKEEELRKEAEAATKLGIDAFFTKHTELPFAVAGAVCFPNQAQFEPLAFVEAIAAKLTIKEETRVLTIKGNRVITRDGEFTASDIVAATHYPLLNVPGFYFLRQHQERSYVLALSGCEKLSEMYYGIDKDGLSFRQMGDNLLLGGSGHRTGQSGKEAFERLKGAAKTYFPDCQIVNQWAAQDCMPHDGIPFIGKYSIFTPNLYVATGFQKWGMTSSMVAALVLRDEICGNENDYRKLFSPQRMNIGASFKNLILDVGISVKGLARGWTHTKKRRCPHMGCELVWNPDEKSWDCPCHGSRFDESGALLDNPAKRDKY